MLYLETLISSMDFVKPLFLLKLTNLVVKIIKIFPNKVIKYVKLTYYFYIMLIIGYTQRLQFKLNPNFVLFNTACNRKTETKNIQ